MDSTPLSIPGEPYDSRKGRPSQGRILGKSTVANGENALKNKCASRGGVSW